ncbi:MAG: PAS domain S-box protein [Thermoplasmata archaeon]|nr:PAS domain S-box protein [Thermoplasmata archaeon]
MPTINQILSHLLLGQKGGQNRIQIIELLKNRPYNLNQLAEIMNLNYRTIKHHMEILLKNELVSTSHTGSYGEVYFLTPEMEGNITLFEDIVNKFEASKKLTDITSTSKFFQNVMEQTHDAVIITDKGGRIFFWNKSAGKLLGYKPEEVMGENIELFQDSDLQQEMLNQAEKGKRIVAHETKLKAKSGELKEVTLTMNCIKDENENLLGFSLLSRDITARKLAEEALRQSEERFRDLTESTSDWIWEVDKKGTYIYASPKIKELLGYEPGKIIGKTPFDLMPPEEAKRVGKAFRAIVKAKQPFDGLENVNLHKNGRVVVLETSGIPLFDANGTFRGFRGIDRDITKRKRVEEEMGLLKDKFEDLYNNAPIMYLSVDMDGIIVECNNTTLAKLGYRKKELVGKKITKFITKESAEGFKNDFPKLLNKGKIMGIERQLVTKSGKIIDAILDVTMDYDEQGKPKKTRATFEDITKRKRTEETLKESEEKHRTLVNSINDLIFVLDKDDNFLEYYPSKEIPLYMKPEAFKNKNINGLMPPQITGPYLKLSKKVRKTGKSETFEYPLEMGKDEIWYSATLSLHEDGKSMVIAVRDITGHHQIENALKESEELYHNVFDTSPYLLYRINSDGKIIDCNDTVIETLGYSKSELIDMPLLNIYADESKPLVKKYFQEWLDTGKLRNKELKIVTKRGKKLDVELNVNTIYDSNNNILSSISLQKVISKRK